VRTFSLGEVIRAQRVGMITSPEGAQLCYRPEHQILGRAAIIEVAWPAPGGGLRSGALEVSPDGEGGLLVAPAEVADDISSDDEMPLPTVPVSGWRHEPGCTCGACPS
jgi:hypothetical protein